MDRKFIGSYFGSQLIILVIPSENPQNAEFS